jgi:curved DNA-binding protein
MKDHFNTLGVDANASDDEIKKAYKRLAMKHHPDRGGDQAKFQEIQEAYDVLSTPQRRAQWNQERQSGAGGPGNFHFNFGFGPQGFEDLFQQFQNGHPFANFRQPMKNRDLRVALEIDLASTLSKQNRQINIRQNNGVNKTVDIEIPRGVMTGMQMRCQGIGDHSNTNLPPGDLYVEFMVQTHPDFHVNGINLTRQLKINCIDAMLGITENTVGIDSKVFEITIPPGTQPNTKFRLAGHGLWDVNQPIRGDLFVEIVLQVPTAPTAEQLNKLQQLVNRN